MPTNPVEKYGVKSKIYRLLLGQILVVFLLALIFMLMDSQTSAISVILGGIVGWLPNLYFAWRVFRISGASNSAKILRRFYLGEFEKFILSIIFLIIVFNFVEPLEIMAFLLTYIVVIVSLPLIFIGLLSKAFVKNHNEG